MFVAYALALFIIVFNWKERLCCDVGVDGTITLNYIFR